MNHREAGSGWTAASETAGRITPPAAVLLPASRPSPETAVSPADALVFALDTAIYSVETSKTTSATRHCNVMMRHYVAVIRRHDAIMRRHVAMMRRHDAIMRYHDAMIRRHVVMMRHHVVVMRRHVAIMRHHGAGTLDCGGSFQLPSGRVRAATPPARNEPPEAAVSHRFPSRRLAEVRGNRRIREQLIRLRRLRRFRRFRRFRRHFPRAHGRGIH